MQPRNAWIPLLLAFWLSLASCIDRSPAVVLQPSRGAAVTVQVEIADTPDAQARGLMYRTHLDPDRGMLFLFEHEAEHSFWMKNTVIPLDMIFIASDGRIVGIHPSAVPFSLAPIGVDAASRAVLEVNGGFAAQHGIAAGDRVTYRHIASTKLP